MKDSGELQNLYASGGIVTATYKIPFNTPTLMGYIIKYTYKNTTCFDPKGSS
jgi:hypothetical protein